MQPNLILAIDQGTTGTTCLLLDTDANVVARSTQDFQQSFPKPGWVEHNPEDIWNSVVKAIDATLRSSQINANQISSIGITNQRETCLVWNRSDSRPVYPAIVWQDRRTAELCQQFKNAGYEAEIREKTGLVLDPYFSASKIKWILDNIDPSRNTANSGKLALGTIDTYLLWRLSGGTAHLTEPSNASRTMLWSLSNLAGKDTWDHGLCQMFSIPEPMLPQVVASNSKFATTLGVPGLPDGIPVHGIAGDQQAALLGQACFTPPMAKCTYGTGAFIVVQTGKTICRSNHGLLSTVAWQLDSDLEFALEGSSFMAGAVVQWLRDGLGIISQAAEIEALAREVPNSGGVTFVPAHAGLGAPHWRPEARGLISGLTRGTTKAHIARAALEGIAMQIGDLSEAIAKDLGKAISELRVDGGASANNLLMQLQADLSGIPLTRPRNLETTALGATFLAGLGCGIWSNKDEISRVWKSEQKFIPNPSEENYRRELREQWSTALGHC